MKATILAPASAPSHACSVARAAGRARSGRRRLAVLASQSGTTAGSAQQGGGSGISAGKFLRESLRGPADGTPRAYAAAAEYLQTLGMTRQSELTRVLDLAMNPNSLFAVRSKKREYNPHARPLDVESDLRPVVECLQDAGFSQASILKVVSEHPPVLCYPAAGRLRPWLACLGRLGLGQAEIVTLVERRPSILGVDVDPLQRLVGFLRESGKSLEEVADLLGSTL